MAAKSLRFPLVLSAITAAVSALSAPAADGMAALGGLGLPPQAAAIVLHIAPVALCFVLVFVGQALTARAGKVVGMLALAGAGFVFGTALAFMLDAGAHAGKLIVAIAGPVRAPTPLEAIGAVTASFFLLLAVFLTGLWLFGPSAQSKNDDPDGLEMAPHERPALGQSALGMLGYGLALGALTLACLAQTPPPSPFHTGLIATAAVGMALALWPSWTIWASADELMRRRILDSYGLSGVAMLIGLFLWTGAELTGLAPPLTTYGAFLLLVIAQTVAAMAAGMSSGALLAAAPKGKAA